ncbi:MAG: o-succinylbenzoate--CoA ligase [Thermomicrobiales bacterium]
MIAPGGEVLLPDCLDVAARTWRDRLALTWNDQRWTFGELAGSVAGAAARLAPLTGGGYRLGLLAANRPGFVFATHAARVLGVPFVPLNWRQTAEEIAWQLAAAEIGVLLVDESRWEVAQGAARDLPLTIVPMAELERAAPSLPFAAPAIPAARELAVLFTSGTTNRPKGVRLSYGNVWFSAVASALHLGHHRDDAWLAMLPMFHVGGLSILFRSALGGVPVYLHEQFDPERALAAIDGGATLVSAVPTVLTRLIETRGDTPWPPSLRCVLLGGAAAPAGLVTESLRRGIPVAPTYGLTETASQATTLLPDEVPSRPGSSGLPLPMTRLRVTTPDGLAAPDEPGAIEVSGPTLFLGYLGEEARGDEWFATGDIGVLDGDGYITVLDRRDDLIVSGGENISPAEIERVLLGHPNVRDAGVIAALDDLWGARPAAAVVWAGEPAAAAATLTAFCRERLAGFKIPVRIDVVDALPRTASGKLLRRELRRQFECRDTECE